MSGTSLDGIDATLVEFPETGSRLLCSAYQPYPDNLRQRLLALHEPASNELHSAALVANELAGRYAATVHDLLGKAGIGPHQIVAIGCHGQTIRHQPEYGYTIQLNNPALLTEMTGITTIADFRSRDIAAGGQGAPLVPAFHLALLRHPERHRVIVNIGGISNLTNLPISGSITGFDCGPGNLLMDAWCQTHTAQRYDNDGAWAARGTVLPHVLEALLGHPFFHKPPPKSAGRENFNLAWLQQFLTGHEVPEDVQATLLQLTVEGIARSIDNYCLGAEEIYLCGGGARNGALVSRTGRPGLQT